MGDASGMYTSPTGARPQNGGAGQGQDNNEGFNNESFQLDGGDQHLESAGGRRTSTGTMATLAGGVGTPSPAQQEPQARPGEQDKSISCLGGLCANSLGSESLYCTD